MDQLQHDRFAELFISHQAQVYRYLVSLMPNRADADELFQQTSLTLWKIWDRYDPTRDFLPWAFGIAQNEVRNFLRHRQRLPHLLGDELIAELAQVRVEENDFLVERQQALTDCLKKLSPQQRELVDRCYGQRETMKSVAEDRHQKPDTLYKSLQRIRDRLFDCVNRSVSLELES